MDRRNWLKSALVFSAGLPVASAMAEELMLAPVSKAEKLHGIYPPNADQLIRLGSNENPYGPSPKARKAIAEVMDSFNRYSYPQMGELKKLIAEKEGVTPDHILLANGSSELLCVAGLGVGLEGGAVLSAYPTFRLLMDYATRFNARWDQVKLDETLTHNLEAMASAVKADTKLLFVVNPNNPTGTILNPDKLRSFCVEMAKKTLVYSDEAYLEFLEPSQQHSMVSLVREGHNVVVTRTFSKIHGLAGIRVGYCIGQPDLIKKWSQYQTGTILNQAAIAAATVALQDEDFMAMTRKKNNEARDYFEKYLKDRKWFQTKSYANVVFFPAPKDGKTILAETEKKGFQIRVWDYDNREWCRVSIGTLEEMKAFTKAFDAIV